MSILIIGRLNQKGMQFQGNINKRDIDQLSAISISVSYENSMDVHLNESEMSEFNIILRNYQLRNQQERETKVADTSEVIIVLSVRDCLPNQRQACSARIFE